jgi:hypothetical protein
VLVVDAGATLAGYFGLLAAASAAGAAGVRTLVVESQPQCAAWAAGAGAASGFPPQRFAVQNALLAGPAWHGRAALRVPARTGCALTTTQPGFFSPREGEGEGEDGGVWHAGGAAGGAARVVVPIVTLADAVEAALAPGDEAGLAVVLLLKLDAAGREADVLAGAAPLLDSGRVLNVIVEVNKQRMAVARGTPSALAAAARRAAEDDELVAAAGGAGVAGGAGGGAGTLADQAGGGGDDVGAAVPTDAAGTDRGLEISDAEDAELSAEIARLVRSLLARGFEVLCADRGWWSAQAPFTPDGGPASDGATVEGWAAKLNRRSEVDVWAYLPATKAGSLPL